MHLQVLCDSRLAMQAFHKIDIASVKPNFYCSAVLSTVWVQIRKPATNHQLYQSIKCGSKRTCYAYPPTIVKLHDPPQVGGFGPRSHFINALFGQP